MWMLFAFAKLLRSCVCNVRYTVSRTAALQPFVRVGGVYLFLEARLTGILASVIMARAIDLMSRLFHCLVRDHEDFVDLPDRS